MRSMAAVTYQEGGQVEIACLVLQRPQLTRLGRSQHYSLLSLVLPDKGIEPAISAQAYGNTRSNPASCMSRTPKIICEDV